MLTALSILLLLCIPRGTSLLLGMSTYLGKNPVFVAGGSRGIGLEVVKQLSALGTPVKALVRKQESKDMLEKFPGVNAFIGDAFNEEDVQSTMSMSPQVLSHGIVHAITL